jgi:hypothetical protein
MRCFKDSLDKARQHSENLEKTHHRLMVSGVVASDISTLVTDITGIQWPIVGQGVPGWRLACIVGAVFGFATTLSVGLNQQLKISDRLSETNQAKAQLSFLEMVIETESRTWEEITREYETIMMGSPHLV